MKTNKILSTPSINKVWENFRKMNGIVLTIPSSSWIESEEGFTNTVYYDGFTADEILEIDLYNDGNLTETQINEYDNYITEFNILNGMMVAAAASKPTVDITVLCRGELVGEKLVNGGGSGGSDINVVKLTQAEYNALPEAQKKKGHYIITDAEGLSAKYMEYDDSETQFGVNNVQDAIVEQSKLIVEQSNLLGGFTPIIDETGQITGYKTSVGGADTVFPFTKNNVKLFHDDNFTWSTWKNGGTYFPTETRSGTNFRFDTYDGICSAYIQSTSKDFTKFKELKLYIVSTKLSNGGTGATTYYNNSFSIINSSGTTVKSISIPYSTSNTLYTIDLSGIEGTHYMQWNISHCQTIFSYLELN